MFREMWCPLVFSCVPDQINNEYLVIVQTFEYGLKIN